MKKITGLCFLGIIFCGLLQAQSTSSYFLMDGEEIYLKKNDREALLILQTNASQAKSGKLSSRVDRVIRKYAAVSSNTGDYHVLRSNEKSPIHWKTLRMELSAESSFQALYPAYEMAGSAVYLTDRILLKLKPQTNILTLHLFLDKYGVKLRESLPGEDGLLCTIEVPDSVDLFQLIHYLEKRKEVIYVEPDLIMTSPAGFYETKPQIQNTMANVETPNDPDFSKQWFLNQSSDADLDAPEAWAISPGDTEVVVAVIDLHGFDLNHIDLKSNIVSPYNATYHNTNPAPQNQYAQHGTPCAGLVTSTTNNQIGIAGIGNKIKVMPVLIGEGVRPDGLTYVWSSAYTRAAEHIVNTPQVVAVSNSFASSSLTNTIRNSYLRMQKETRKGLGAVVLASSGNWNRENQAIYPYYLPGVIGVGATNYKDKRTGFSNYGDSLDIVAPGDGIFTTLNDNAYGYFGGTSASSPIAAGLVGLIASARPNMKASQLTKILLESCEKIGGYTYAPRENYLYGDWNKEMGYGRINALQALQAAMKLSPPGAPIIQSAVGLTNSQIHIQWKDTSGRSQAYVLERSEAGQHNFKCIALLTKTETSFTDSLLKENTNYCYRLMAENEDGFSPYSKAVCTVTQGKPSAPQHLSYSVDSLQRIILSWDDPIGNGNVTQWEIHRYLSNQNTLVLDTTFFLTDTKDPNSLVDSHLILPELYIYEVVASNQYGQSPPSNLVKVGLGALTFGQTILTTCREIMLDPGGVEDYGNDQHMLCKIKPGKQNYRIRLEFLDFDLENQQDFLYIYEGPEPKDDQLIGIFTGSNLPPTIQAENAGGELSLLFTSDRSVTRPGFRINLNCVPYVPAVPIALKVDTLSEESLRLSWLDVSDNEEGFEIWRAEPGQAFKLVHQTAPNDTIYTDKSLFPATYYSYKIRSWNQGGYSAFSTVISAGTLSNNSSTKGFWTKKSDFISPQSGIQGAVGFAIDDRAYVLTTSGKLFQYDPLVGNLGQWIYKSDFPGGGRYNPIAMVIRGKAYIGLGYFEDDLWEYDPLTNTWTAKDTYPEGFERYQLIAFTIGEKGYVGIGDGEKDLWQFNPKDLPGQQWQRMNDMPNDAQNRYFPAAFSIGSKGYVTSGYYGSYLTDLWEFDPFAKNKGKWTHKASVGVGRAEGVAFSVGDKGYLGTGSKGSKLKDFWEYDPRTDSWKQMAAYGGSSRSLAFGFAIRDKAYIGGGSGGIDFWQYSPPLTPGAPEAPDSLQAGLDSLFKFVDLTWNDISLDEIGFEVYRSENPDEPYTLIGITNTQETYFRDVSIKMGKHYHYRIKSFNFIASSEPSNEVFVSVFPPAPQTPESLQAEAVDDSSIRLSWKDLSEVEDLFQIFRWEDESSRFEKIAEVPANSISYQDKGLLSQRYYRYEIRAVNLGGESDFSNEAGDTTLLSLPPVPEKVTAIALSAQAIRVEWEDWSSLAERYELYKFDQDIQDFVLLYEARAGENSYTDDFLKPETSYSYKIRALNAAGYSNFSPEVSTSTLSESPNPPSDLQAQALSSYRIALSWTDQSENERFFVLESLVGNNFMVLDTLAANQSTYIHKNLYPATTYSYRVKAVNEFGSLTYHNLGYSNQASATTFGLSPPAIPENLHIEAISSSDLLLSWYGFDDEGLVFEIYRKDFAGEDFLKIGETQGLTWNENNLEANTAYYYKILASNELGSSSFSEIGEGITLPDAPINLKVSRIDESKVLLEWTSAHATEVPCEFEVERSVTDTLHFEQKAISSSNQPYFLDRTIDQSKTFYYRVRARNSSGYSAYTHSIRIEPNLNSDQQVFEIIPNPVQETLNIRSNSQVSSQLYLKILHISGQILKSDKLEELGNVNEFSVDVGDLPKGVYILQVYRDDQTWTKRFVKQ